MRERERYLKVWGRVNDVGVKRRQLERGQGLRGRRRVVFKQSMNSDCGAHRGQLRPRTHSSSLTFTLFFFLLSCPNCWPKIFSVFHTIFFKDVFVFIFYYYNNTPTSAWIMWLRWLLSKWINVKRSNCLCNNYII